MKLWTVTSNYAATGEGHTLKAIVAYAPDELIALKQFEQEFGDFYILGAEASEGVNVNDPVLKGLFNLDLLERIKKIEGQADVVLTGSMHVNFS